MTDDEITEDNYVQSLRDNPFPYPDGLPNPPHVSELERAAYHEAGHVVCTMTLGAGPIDTVSIDDLGNGSTKRKTTRYRVTDPFKELVVMLAGYYAERRHAGEGVMSPIDERNATRAFYLLSPAERWQAHETCQTLLNARWHYVEAIAVHLMRLRSLTREEILEILDRSITHATDRTN